ncbi:MAG: DUF1697 domain-containing protein [Verrucomicrobia bacterium]|nr:DUF1697 domain-containing protein [Verrucomicrobiota bacterium]MBV9275013.1 DUF1697 domain-containing protein [Verrucomicrobiota bacterium]
MATQIALLRAVNVGGTKLVNMAELRAFLIDVGFEGVQSWLQSGNLVFRSKEKNGAALESFLEKTANRTLGLKTTFFVRTAEQWSAIIKRNPLPDEARLDPTHLLMLILKSAPTHQQVGSLRVAVSGPEIIEVIGREAYIFYRAGIGKSRLTVRLIETKLGTPATGRNWNTVLKLETLAAGLA